MKEEANKEGRYELYETAEHRQVLRLDEKEWYVLEKDRKEDLIIRSDSNNEKKKTIQKGKYFLADFADEPEYNDLPHLFMEKGSGYTELILPNGLPSRTDDKKRMVRPGNRSAKPAKKGDKKRSRGSIAKEKDLLRTKIRNRSYRGGENPS